MTAPTNTFQTYQAIGNREDLIDMIYNVAPTETPFLSGIKRTKATAVKHEWQTDTLDAAANNKQIEGDDTAAAAATPTVRLDNYCQISKKVYIVSGTQEAVNKAGRKSEIAYQRSKKQQEIKRDMEFALLQNSTYAVGDATTARQLRGVLGWVFTNDDFGAGGASPAPSTNTAQTDGTQRAFLESQLKNVLQLVWAEGGDPTVLMVGAFNKQAVSGFTGGSTVMNDAGKERIAAFDVYRSDFGTLKVVPNRFQRTRDAFVLDMDYWKLATLRDFENEELAKTGDARKFHIVNEYTLQACNEKASGAIRDLTTA